MEGGAADRAGDLGGRRAAAGGGFHRRGGVGAGLLRICRRRTRVNLVLGRRACPDRADEIYSALYTAPTADALASRGFFNGYTAGGRNSCLKRTLPKSAKWRMHLLPPISKAIPGHSDF